MTVPELISKLNIEYTNGAWPDTYEIDAETYANVCHYIFVIRGRSPYERVFQEGYGKVKVIGIAIGPRDGIMFRNVELIIK